ncbi:MAG: hypothetical protein LBC83_05595 [Oscillospiraceae bacterium]|jgi:hypothetical protein|nr:hypothetical protein [Oscillospiraceae bacterium]
MNIKKTQRPAAPACPRRGQASQTVPVRNPNPFAKDDNRPAAARHVREASVLGARTQSRIHPPKRAAAPGKPAQAPAHPETTQKTDAPKLPLERVLVVRPQLPRAHYAAYADTFELRLPAGEGDTMVIPMEEKRAGGGFRTGCPAGCGAVVPAAGYYLLLWELGIEAVEGAAVLELGVNDRGTVLSESVAPGYDSGQQFSWLEQDDCVTLGCRHAERSGDDLMVHGKTAQLTLIRLG